MLNKLQYENIFRGNMGAIYARVYNPETKEATTKPIKSIPSIYVEDSKNEYNTGLISIPEKKPLKELRFKTMKDFRETFNLYKSSNVSMYGNKSQEQTYIRENWPNPSDSYHDFSNTWFWDIETAVGLDPEFKVNVKGQDRVLSFSQIEKLENNNIPYTSELTFKEIKKLVKDDWKPTGHERAAKASITSIQIFDTKAQEFYILGLKKDWDNETNFTSPHGKVNYFKFNTEEDLLKNFLSLLIQRDPAILSGWNTAGYDDPYVTNRIIRILDKRSDLYYYDELKAMWKFNTDCLTGEFVKLLSPHGKLIRHREVQTNFGIQDEFKWVGIIQEDYLDMYKKYTYTIHTSYSLSNIAMYELGSNKVNHDEFADFRAFYEGDYKKYDYDEKKEEKNELDLLYIELSDIDTEISIRKRKKEYNFTGSNGEFFIFENNLIRQKEKEEQLRKEKQKEEKSRVERNNVPLDETREYNFTGDYKNINKTYQGNGTTLGKDWILLDKEGNCIEEFNNFKRFCRESGISDTEYDGIKDFPTAGKMITKGKLKGFTVLKSKHWNVL